MPLLSSFVSLVILIENLAGNVLALQLSLPLGECIWNSTFQFLQDVISSFSELEILLLCLAVLTILVGRWVTGSWVWSGSISKEFMINTHRISEISNSLIDTKLNSNEQMISIPLNKILAKYNIYFPITEISTFYYQEKTIKKMLLFSPLLIIMLLISFFESAIISVADSLSSFTIDCIGNFEKVDGKCVPCPNGFTKEGDKCISQNYELGSGNSKQTIENCEVLGPLSLHCLVCKVGYYKNTNASEKTFGTCIKNDCQIYFEGLRQCLSSQSKILENYRPEKSFWVNRDDKKEGYNEFKYKRMDTLQLSIVSSNFYLALQINPDNTFIENKVDVTEFHHQNSVNPYFFHRKLNIEEQKIGCIKYDDKNRCQKCQDGFYFNFFTKKCQESLLNVDQSKNDEKISDCEQQKQISDQSFPFCLRCKPRFFYSYFSQSCQEVDPKCIKYQENGKCIQFEEGPSKNN